MNDGRYVFPGNVLRAVTDDKDEAARLSAAWKTEPRFDPGVSLTYIGRKLQLSDYPYGSRLVIWSDGVVSIVKLYPDREPASFDLTEDAEWILRQALGLKQWSGGRWKQFMNVSTVARQELAKDSDSRTTLMSSSSWEATTYELQVVYKDDKRETLYWGYLSAGSLGEDGDAWADRTLVETRAEVDAWLLDQRLTYQ